MEDFINNFYNKNKDKSEYSISSVKNCINKLNEIYNVDILDKKFKKNMVKRLRYEEINEKIENLNTRIKLMSCLNIIHKYKDTKINKKKKGIFEKLLTLRNYINTKNEKTEKEKINWIDYDELKRKTKEYAEYVLNNNVSFINFRNVLILCLYVLIPPTRLGNYLDMKLIIKYKYDLKKRSKEYNYIVKKNNNYVFIFNKYKTVKYLGQLIYEVKNDLLNKMIDKYFNEYNLYKKYFLINFTGKKMSQSNLTEALKSITRKIFKKEINLNMLRHIFITWLLKQNITTEEKKNILELMGQKYNINMSDNYNRV